MREIKFRAWDKEEKIMRTVTDLALNWEEGLRPTYVHSEGPMGGEMRTLRGGNCIVMQFTGLKDKTGKEIYEGDVVQFVYSNGSIDRISVDYKIIQQNFISGFRLPLLTPGGYETIEVIGNIYENPELLK